MTKKLIALAVLASSLSFVAPAMAQTAPTPAPAPSSAQSAIACVGAAVNAREASLDSAITTYTQAVSADYSARAIALQHAYTLATATQVRAAVKTAWSTFNASMKSASKAWKTARTSDWVTFRTAAAACKAPSTVNDSANASSEAVGQ